MDTSGRAPAPGARKDSLSEEGARAAGSEAPTTQCGRSRRLACSGHGSKGGVRARGRAPRPSCSPGAWPGWTRTRCESAAARGLVPHVWTSQRRAPVATVRSDARNVVIPSRLPTATTTGRGDADRPSRRQTWRPVRRAAALDHRRAGIVRRHRLLGGLRQVLLRPAMGALSACYQRGPPAGSSMVFDRPT